MNTKRFLAVTLTLALARSAFALSDSGNFVQQQYVDFLNRAPDADGLSFWTGEIDNCIPKPQCVDAKRVNVSAAFFLSTEFQQTGYFVYRLYKAAYGNLPDAPVPVKYSEFIADTRKVSAGVIVGKDGWEKVLEGNKKAFVLEFVKRPRFANSKIKSAQALTAAADDPVLQQQEFNRAFVLMQYFGYLHRNPDDPPEPTLDFQGFNFWLTKLDKFKGDYAGAEMVKAFINSTEYVQRFSPYNVRVEEYLPPPEQGNTAVVTCAGIQGEIHAHKGMQVFQKLLRQRKRINAAAIAGPIDLAPLITAAEKELDHGRLVVKCSGPIATSPVFLTHDTRFDDVTITSDQQGTPTVPTPRATFVPSDNVTITLVHSAIEEPTWNDGVLHPINEVFQARGDYFSSSHEGKDSWIAIVMDKDSMIHGGRQLKYDGGIRQAISFSNCNHCSCVNCNLIDTSSIGIGIGGSNLSGDQFADHCLVYGGVFKGLQAAMVAPVNADHTMVINVKCSSPGHKDRPEWGAGIMCIDQETNAELDHGSDNVYANTKCDFTDGYTPQGMPASISIGSCIALQNTQNTSLGGSNNTIINMIADGGLQPGRAPMSSGIILSGQRGARILNSTVIRSVQSGFITYAGSDNLVDGFTCDNCAGGGIQAISLIFEPKWNAAPSNTTLSRIQFLRSLGGGDPRIKDCGVGTTVKDSPGIAITTEQCRH